MLEGRGKSRDVRRFNATFAQAVLEMGVGVEMCAPRSGNQKGTVEAIVKWVKNSFFKGRVFRDDADLHEQLDTWLSTGTRNGGLHAGSDRVGRGADKRNPSGNLSKSS